ncbi:HAMP domain-containing protein (plasmid) [Skermanella rosea]|uniref:adenylate/guanylate cyclase domain-containing protein n=1 Tax=Skermanella rosea TaxID=1817965 RepID=UPI00193241C0|nr:adenylate/guanylate cyclase domain-containing protein [Skermanella rosea]UEM07769.1 HAMP domain-containing protein [Skermanella rosea]
MQISLRNKLLVFAIAIAVVPLLVAGRSMVRIVQDELKSSANGDLAATAEQIVTEINDRAERTWLAPLLLIRNALDDQRLGVPEKIALLTLGINDLPEFAALQITVEGAPVPVVVTNGLFAKRLSDSGIDPLKVLRLPEQAIRAAVDSGEFHVGDVSHVAATDDWLATIVLPLRSRFAGAPAVLSVRIDLDRTRRFLENHPFAKTGFITVVDREGRRVFDPRRDDLGGVAMAAEALDLLRTGNRTIAAGPYVRPDGQAMLGAYAFPRPFDWVVMVEKRQEDAYLAVDRMIGSLFHWVLAGVAVAVAGSILLAFRISRPIIEIDRVAGEVARGNFQVRVQDVHSRDEIGDLAQRINAMVVGLNERFHLQKFVSGGTMLAIRNSDGGIKLGGERQRVAMLFSDIRGYTAFAERVDPETVVEMLNFYFQHQAEIVQRHHGDVDKYVGDQLLAVFQGDEMVANAVRAALDIQEEIASLSARHPDWKLSVGIGLHAGEVVMGAMGSLDRMDYTVLGDNVNLAARLCSHAKPGNILLSETVQQAIRDCAEFETVRLPPVTLKGKRDPVPVFEVSRRATAGLATRPP